MVSIKLHPLASLRCVPAPLPLVSSSPSLPPSSVLSYLLSPASSLPPSLPFIPSWNSPRATHLNPIIFCSRSTASFFTSLSLLISAPFLLFHYISSSFGPYSLSSAPPCSVPSEHLRSLSCLHCCLAAFCRCVTMMSPVSVSLGEKLEELSH